MDKPRFNIQNDSRRTKWRKPGTCYQMSGIVRRDHYRSGGLLVWPRLATNGRTYLYVLSGCSVTVVRYRAEIQRPLMGPFIDATGTYAIFMDDNPHRPRAGVVRSYLESETISHLVEPARSPDHLNSIHHMWDMLGHQIAGRTMPPDSLHELRHALLHD
ncbi:uncharacterized protein LOC118189183 [Stegodyphus dumicola]|uniref:uncharacterized protein LOC118189183 n=1 Tax=Stegodyphus dumicola TaxID=202533 RepID=UPI0015B1CD92|nr:uncharacterized protein LOC118189183 [Stegodyphus dumicola]